MKKHTFIALGLTAMTLGGCAAIPSFTGANTAPDPTDPCGAQGYTSLLGASLAAVTLPADLNDRVTRQGDVVTTDYDPTRLNIELDNAGTIVGLSCG